jgi:hypothetical protein
MPVSDGRRRFRFGLDAAVTGANAIAYLAFAGVLADHLGGVLREHGASIWAEAAGGSAVGGGIGRDREQGVAGALELTGMSRHRLWRAHAVGVWWLLRRDGRGAAGVVPAHGCRSGCRSLPVHPDSPD